MSTALTEYCTTTRQQWALIKHVNNSIRIQLSKFKSNRKWTGHAFIFNLLKLLKPLELLKPVIGGIPVFEHYVLSVTLEPGSENMSSYFKKGHHLHSALLPQTATNLHNHINLREMSHFCQMMQQFHCSLQLHIENITLLCFVSENINDVWFWLVSSSRGSRL